ncbi:hypothetical protein ACLEPN_19550 [Myxococcus sp. 1LA]
MRRSSLLAASVLFFVGCAQGPARRADPVAFVPLDLSQRASLEPWAISMPFETGQDGTDLVLSFLDRAEASGARFVSDLQVVFVTKQGDQPLECTTRLVPEEELEAAPRDIHERLSSVSGSGSPLALEDFLYSATEFACVSAPATRLVRQYYTAPSELPQNRVRESAAQDSFRGGGTSCGYMRVDRYLPRYAFQAAVQYVPPIPYRLRDARPELALAESRAECVPMDPFAPTVNRIEAVVYGGAGPKAALEAALQVHPVRSYL